MSKLVALSQTVW